MYQIIKVLNNNSLVACCNGEEFIFLGKGIGFNKKSKSFFSPDNNVKVYRMETQQQEQRQPGDIIQHVDPMFIEIADSILSYAKKFFENIDTRILLPLADHIDFSIKRMKENIDIQNPFTKEIKIFFQQEYEIALYGKEVIYKKTKRIISDDEVGYIALHIHSAITSEHISITLNAMDVIQNSIDQLRKEMNIEIDDTSMSYMRLMNHFKYMLLRIQTDEKLAVDINEFASKKFPFAYQQARLICYKLTIMLKKPIPQNEIGYLALHLERVLMLES
ncbi:MAG: PRD domain-containing protein [Faecalibacillus sp.]